MQDSIETQNSFVVSPIKEQISLKPGETYEGQITVTNPANAKEDFEYKIVALPYSVSGTDYQPDIETMTDWTKLAEWISFEQATGVLKPNDSAKVKYKITVPKDAPGGGQYAMIAVSSVVSAKTRSTEIQNVYRMGTLLYASIDGKITHKGQILDNYIPGFVASGTPTTIVTVSNDGNVHETLRVNLKVKNALTGQEISLTGDEKDEYESTIMPNSTRVLSRGLEGLPGLGFFEVTQDVSYIGQVSNNTGVLMICPIWFMALVLITVTAIIVGAVYKVIKRRKKSTKNQLPFEGASGKIES